MEDAILLEPTFTAIDLPSRVAVKGRAVVDAGIPWRGPHFRERDCTLYHREDVLPLLFGPADAIGRQAYSFLLTP